MGVIHPGAGDEGAVEFAALYRRQFGFVWSLTGHFGVHSAAREDVAQEVWLTVHRRLDTLRADASPRAWVASITRRVAARHHRAQHRAQRKLAALAAIDRSDVEHGSGPDAFAMIDAALARMDVGQREVFLLTQVEELSGPEVARILEVPLNTVYSRLRLARARLAESLAELEHAEREVVDALREPAPPSRVSARVWLVVTGELGVRGSAAVIASGWASKLAIVAASGIAVIAIGSATAAAIPTPELATPTIASIAEEHASAPVHAGTQAPEVPCEPPASETIAAATIAPMPAPVKRPRSSVARAEPPVRTPAPNAAPAPSDASASDRDAAEVALLAAAISAERRGDLGVAKTSLARLREQFPAGKLVIARRAEQVRVACAAGDVVGARAAAKQLVAEHPGDPTAVGVRDVCSPEKTAAPP
jgi:RNA polymerase sigma factor (sigma-70 family)